MVDKVVSFLCAVLCASGLSGCALFMTSGSAVRASYAPETALAAADAQTSDSVGAAFDVKYTPPDTESASSENVADLDALLSTVGPVSDSMAFDSALGIPDFGDAFPAAPADPVPPCADTISEPIHPAPKVPRIGAHYPVATDLVRVGVVRDAAKVTLFAPNGVRVGGEYLQGRIAVRADERGVVVEAGGLALSCALPCTLSTQDHTGSVDIGEITCRGSVIVSAVRSGRFAVVNLAWVEDYLRGVVPLEIGTRSLSDLEAVKAQAVAARTYTYRRIIDRQQESWDLLTTVADQVFGGVTVETPVADKAILATRNVVMACGDELIWAYYFSTCGGRTANVEDVWDKSRVSYLRSIRDVDARGHAYCAFSPQYSWTERWKSSDLASIMKRYSREAFPKSQPFSGSIRNISVQKTFSDGRVKDCLVETSSGVYSYGGDRIRFLMRRNTSGMPILKSSFFTTGETGVGQIVLSGHGYGHGVGMCQMGAIGRARAGQAFNEILGTYYTGVRFVRVEPRE